MKTTLPIVASLIFIAVFSGYIFFVFARATGEFAAILTFIAMVLLLLGFLTTCCFVVLIQIYLLLHKQFVGEEEEPIEGHSPSIK